ERDEPGWHDARRARCADGRGRSAKIARPRRRRGDPALARTGELMAKGRSPRVSGAAAAPPPSDRDLVIDAAFRLVAAAGWRRLSLAAIADEARIPILRVTRAFPAKPAILCGF